MSSCRSLVTGLLTAAALAVTGVLGAAAAQAEPHPDHTPQYEAKADLNGHGTPSLDAGGVADFVRRGQTVKVKCQILGGPAYGSRLWDLVSTGNGTLFVPDRFISTGTDGRAPELDECSAEDLRSVGA